MCVCVCVCVCARVKLKHVIHYTHRTCIHTYICIMHNIVLMARMEIVVVHLYCVHLAILHSIIACVV